MKGNVIVADTRSCTAQPLPPASRDRLPENMQSDGPVLTRRAFFPPRVVLAKNIPL